MALLVLCYPSITQSDYEWIQTIRAQHDPQYDMIAPHFTLVFPTSSHTPEFFIEHVRAQAQGQPPIVITLACAIVVKDPLSAYTHTFLVPDQGFSALVKLHDKLYSGLLTNDLRLDIPFIPHITVASSLDPQVCKRVTDEFNRQNQSICGFIRLVDIVSFANRSVTILERIALN